jgi:hypothetical protein
MDAADIMVMIRERRKDAVDIMVMIRGIRKDAVDITEATKV